MFPDCTNFHHRGSSARYVRHTCKDCGIFHHQEEREVAEPLDPALCPHQNVDHRGSNKLEYKTFCKDCQTTIDSIPMDLHRETEAAKKTLLEANIADTEMILRAMDSSQVSREQMIIAGQIFVRDAQLAEPGQYASKDVIASFIVRVPGGSLSTRCMDTRSCCNNHLGDSKSWPT